MAKFEVFIPAAGAGTFDLTFRVEADNWLAALNTGLKKIGEKGGAGSNLLVDIHDDNSIHVTEPTSQRVFRITEMEPPPEAVEASQIEASNPFDPMPGRITQLELPSVAVPSPRAGGSTLPATQLSAVMSAEGAGSFSSQSVTVQNLPALDTSNTAVNLAATAAPAQRPGTLPPASVNAVRPPTTRPKSGAARRPSGVAKTVTELPREQAQAPKGRIGRERSPATSGIDEVLAELFERVQELWARDSPEEAMNLALDMAMEKIAAESGSIFLADLSSNGLTLSTARGPKSQELLRLNPHVPMGVGIVGFCAQEGVAMAISDAQRDPRFFRAISERIGYETKTILCVPMIRNGRTFGCIEVLNKKSSNRFTEGEVGILAYLGEATARYLESVG